MHARRIHSKRAKIASQPLKTVENVDVRLRRPDQHKVGRHLNSVFIHYKRWIISVYVSTPTYSRRKHANSSSTCCMHLKHVCMNACAHARPDRFGQCFWPSRLSRCMKACMRLEISISYCYLSMPVHETLI